MSARDPRYTAEAAKICWVDWMPGDGTAYRVHAPVIAGGPDRSDRTLLLNCVGRTVAFQFSLTEYRHQHLGRWTKTKAREQGIPEWAWRAAEPLLAAYGATERSLVRTGLDVVRQAGHSVREVELPGGAP
ncbi:hypothetical protein [Amycolatopsis sp. NPDC049159]|uniref:hypothetical protein n=1 Tax=Amycolatopsis sp. NPDC049159 TaxID=3157210 RepID=UPI0033D1C3C7